MFSLFLSLKVKDKMKKRSWKDCRSQFFQDFPVWELIIFYNFLSKCFFINFNFIPAEPPKLCWASRLKHYFQTTSATLHNLHQDNHLIVSASVSMMSWWIRFLPSTPSYVSRRVRPVLT